MYFREIQIGVIGFKDYEEIEISPYSVQIKKRTDKNFRRDS